MKRILASAMVIVSLLAVVMNVTLAVFSDTEFIAGNTISTGTIDIELGALDSGEIPKPLNIDGLMPGEWSDWGRVEVTNTAASNPVRLYFYVDNVIGGACDEVNIQLDTGALAGDEHEFTVYSSALQGIEGYANKTEITGYEFDPNLPADTTTVVQQRVQLDLSAENDESSESCEWREVFVAESVPAEEPPTSFPVSFSEED